MIKTNIHVRIGNFVVGNEVDFAIAGFFCMFAKHAMKHVIIEGVTGSGKTSILKRLQLLLGDRALPIDESYTLGLIMEQVKDDDWISDPQFDALDSVLARMEQHQREHRPEILLVERFHLTPYALFPYWKYYDKYDKELAAMPTALILLTFPDELVEERSIDRVDEPEYADTMIEYYGSRSSAIEAVNLSQHRRIDALKKTRLPFLQIDTQKQDWDGYGDAILEYINKSS